MSGRTARAAQLFPPVHGGRIFAALVTGAVTFLLALLPVQAVGATGGTCTLQAAWGTPNAALATDVVTLVNAHRAKMGLAPLAVSPTLTRAAQFKSAHMAGAGYFGHDDPAPLSRTVVERLADCGYTAPTWAENIGKGYLTAQAAVDGWLASVEGHKENIEKVGVTHIGVGVVAAADGTHYWTQEFGIAQAEPQISTGPLATPPAGGTAEYNNITVHKTVPKRVTKRRGVLKKRKSRTMRLKAASGARKVAMSVRVRGKGWTKVRLKCANRTITRRAKSSRPAKVSLKGVTASRCTLTLRSSKRPMRYRLHAVTT